MFKKSKSKAHTDTAFLLLSSSFCRKCKITTSLSWL